MKCDDCGLLYSYPQPTREVLNELYDDSYFVSHSSAEKGYDNYLNDAENIKRTFEKRFRYIERFFAKPGKLLEVGCATGFFLEVAKKRGWQADGIEISKFAAQHAREKDFNVFCGTLDEFESGEKYDCIVLWDVIEHVSSPRQALTKIRGLLKPGGFVFFTTPGIDSLTHFLFKDKWMGFKEHEHLFFFDKKTMSSLLNQCGFSVKLVKFEGKHVSLDLFKRRIGCYAKPLSALLRKWFPPKQGRGINFYVNPFDIHLFAAKRAD